MNILTKLVVREWIRAFIGAFLVLFLITSVADILSGFIRGKTADYVFTYYMIKMPDFLSKILPAACLLSTLFSLNNLKNHSELIAILATGFSVKKIILIIIYLSAIVSTFQFVVVSYLQPASNKLKLNYEDELQFEKLKKHSISTSSLESERVWYKSNTYFASFTGFDREKNELKELSLYFYSQSFRASKIIHAKTATYVKDNLWTLKSVTSHSKLENNEFPEPKNFTEITLALDEVPEDFNKFESEVRTLNIISLKNFISRMERTGINVIEYKVIFYEKIALSFTCLIFALIALNTLYSPNRRGGSFAKTVIYTLGFSLGFWVLHTSTMALGTSGGLPPVLAAATIPLIFSLFILGTFYKHRKL